MGVFEREREEDCGCVRMREKRISNSSVGVFEREREGKRDRFSGWSSGFDSIGFIMFVNFV